MLIIGIAGTTLSAEERDWLQHPAVAGVILFKRNFASRGQVAELAAALREAAPRPQLLCVDQEGGRVQRFVEGFTKLPALAPFGALHGRDPGAALRLAQEHAWLMASEIRAIGLDLSFAPVVDLGRGNLAIGDRAFHPDPQVVAAFTRAYVQGMHAAGMAATLKHFPGHGTVLEDTHFDDAVDPRPLDVLRAEDLVPFVAGIEAKADAVMMLRTMMALARVDGRVCAFLEPIATYMTKDLYEPGDGLWLTEYPAPDRAIPLGEGRVYGEGDDLVVAHHVDLPHVLHAQGGDRLGRRARGVLGHHQRLPIAEAGSIRRTRRSEKAQPTTAATSRPAQACPAAIPRTSDLELRR